MCFRISIKQLVIVYFSCRNSQTKNRRFPNFGLKFRKNYRNSRTKNRLCFVKMLLFYLSSASEVKKYETSAFKSYNICILRWRRTQSHVNFVLLHYTFLYLIRCKVCLSHGLPRAFLSSNVSSIARIAQSLKNKAQDGGRTSVYSAPRRVSKCHTGTSIVFSGLMTVRRRRIPLQVSTFH